MPLPLKNVNLYVPEPLCPGDVLIEGDKIVAVHNADLTAMNGSGRIVITMVGGEVVYRA